MFYILDYLSSSFTCLDRETVNFLITPEHLNINPVLIEIYIIMCRVIRVTKIPGSSFDDWIYLHLGYNFA
jgi:hypothetical protein